MRGRYDPRAHGARCDQCVLNGRRVVPPQALPVAQVLADPTAAAVVGEAPGEQEEKRCRVFVGPSGGELDAALRAGGLQRSRVHVTNVLLCRPPGNRLKDLLVQIKRYNKAEARKAKKAGEPPPTPVPDPLECCAPRLKAELAPFRNIVTLGNYATRAVTGTKQSVMAIRGSLLKDETEGYERKIMATVHPAFVLRNRRWTRAFRSDVAKAAQWFRGHLDWVPPELLFNPSPDELHRLLYARPDFLTYDTETDGIEPLTARIRCLGIGYPDVVAVLGFLGRDGQRKFYPPEEEAEVKRVLQKGMTDPNRIKVGHNAGYYDRFIVERNLGYTPSPLLDTLLVHRAVEPELPHGLAYVGSLYTTAPAWKTDREGNKLATGGESDEELQEYCGFDVAVNARCTPALLSQLRVRDQAGVFSVDTQMQAICVGMHEVGMYVDQKERLKTEKKLLKRRQLLLDRIRGAVGRPEFNPASVLQVRDLLFGRWELEVPLEDKDIRTGTGEMSTSDHVLRALLSDAAVTEEKRAVLRWMRAYRRAVKLIGTYVTKLRPTSMVIEGDLGWADEDEEWLDRETRKKYGIEKRGIVDPTMGRMYPGWNAHVAVTGRLSSSKPINAMNFPKGLRAMVRAAPGHVLVGADLDQIELRISAARWRLQKYLVALAQGKDPHSITAFSVFGGRWLQAIGMTEEEFLRPGPFAGPAYVDGVFSGEGDSVRFRNLSKAILYAFQYKASVPTGHRLITSAELPALDENGKERADGATILPFARLGLPEIRGMYDAWFNGNPEYAQGWQRELDTFRRLGYLREDITGRRRDFLDGEDPNEIVNFPIQASAAGWMNLALIELCKHIRPFHWGPGTGLINQCHDSLVIECPADGAHQVPHPNKEKAARGKKKMIVPEGSIPDRVARLIEECLNGTHPALPGVTITASASVGLTWKEVG
jgi:DNA polymerase I-like protein with 3'-5' exonuclease and polymerase domains/uracil-DNA glycosylase